VESRLVGKEDAMMILLPGNVGAFREAVVGDASRWGWLITPRRPMTRSAKLLQAASWAADNECFSLGDRFDPERYIRFLKRVASLAPTCLFAVAPDVVADAAATLSKFPRWAQAIKKLDLPVALVAQDGLENLAVPWDSLDALFIGGSTEWKLGEMARMLVAEARRRGKWVHVGRVNSQVRLRYCIHLGVDSVDGTEWAINPGRGIRWATQVMAEMDRQLRLL
jgi:hypothetical protein